MKRQDLLRIGQMIRQNDNIKGAERYLTADTPLVVRGVLPRPIAGNAEQITDLGVSDQDRPECSRVPGVSRGQAKSDNTVQSARKENRQCAGAEMLRRTALS